MALTSPTTSWRGARSIRNRRTSEQPSMIATCSRTQQSALGRHPSSLKWQTGSAGASCGTWKWTLVSRVTEGCNVLAGQSAVTAVETIPAPVAMLLLSAQHLLDCHSTELFLDHNITHLHLNFMYFSVCMCICRAHTGRYR